MRLNLFRSGRLLAMAFGALWAIIWIGYMVYEQPGVRMSYAISWPDELAAKVDRCEWGDATRDVRINSDSGPLIGVTLCFKAQRTSTGVRLIRYPGRNLATAQEVIDLSNGNKEKLGTAEFEAVVRRFLEAKNENRGGADSAITRQGIELFSRSWEVLYVAYLNAEKQGDARRAQELAKSLAALTAIRFTKIDHHSVEFDRYADAVAKGFTLSAGAMDDAQQQLSSARLELWKDATLYLIGGLVVGWVLVVCVGWIARRALGIPMGKDTSRRKRRAKNVAG
jgi:hypothetical protein